VTRRCAQVDGSRVWRSDHGGAQRVQQGPKGGSSSVAVAVVGRRLPRLLGRGRAQACRAGRQLAHGRMGVAALRYQHASSLEQAS